MSTDLRSGDDGAPTRRTDDDPGGPADPVDPAATVRNDHGEPTREAMSARRRATLGVVELAAAAFMVWAFGLGSPPGEDATFVMRASGIDAPDVTLPVRSTVWVLAFVVAVLGGVQLARGFGRRATPVLGLAAALFVVALMAWAASGTSFSFTGTLQLTLGRAAPLALGALAGLLCEKAGVVNIAIEGMMLLSAFAGAFVASAAGNLWIGLIAALLTGGLFGSVLAVLSIRYRVDQVIGGTVINIFAIGFTGYLYSQIFTQYPDLNNSGTFSIVKIPVLSQIPVIGPVLFTTNIFTYATLILVGSLTWLYASTRWGLRVRAVGEHPKAADTVGIDVRRTRFRSVVLGGMVAGLAGAFLSLGSLGRFEEEMTAGRGFIALAALIFGRWKPVGAFGAALLFGFAEALQIRLSSLSTPIPSQFLLMAPYVLTLVAVAGLVGRSRPPAADGQPY